MTNEEASMMLDMICEDVTRMHCAAVRCNGKSLMNAEMLKAKIEAIILAKEALKMKGE